MLESQLQGHILYDSICTKRVNEEMTTKVDESFRACGRTGKESCDFIGTVSFRGDKKWVAVMG